MAGGELYAFDCSYKREMMIKKQAGFTLVELMVTMVIFVLVIAAASSMFTGILNQFKQQSKIAETNIEGIVGLQMLRTDIEQAGYGLPYDLDGVIYCEAENAAVTSQNDTNYNDTNSDCDVSNPPRAFVMGPNAGVNSSDVLVVKATNVATNGASHKWVYISNTGANNIMRSWTGPTGAAVTDENLAANDRVIVLRPAVGSNQQVLVRSAGFTAQFKSSLADFSDNFEPLANSFETYIVYGVTPPADPVDTALRMPFNRADYYIRRPATNMPTRCAPGTGILYKATVNHSDGELTELPLFDCVADMQLAFERDDNDDGIIDGHGDLPTLTAEQVRERVKEVRVYILAHEGQKDPFFKYVPPVYTPAAPDTIKLMDPDAGELKAFNLDTVIGATYVNYRWKIYTMVIKPFNLR